MKYDRAVLLKAELDKFLSLTGLNLEASKTVIDITNSERFSQTCEVRIKSNNPSTIQALSAACRFYAKQLTPRTKALVYREDLRAVELCQKMRTFVRDEFGAAADVTTYVNDRDCLLNWFKVKNRGTHEQLKKMDAAAKRFAAEMDPNIKLDFI